MWIPTSDLPTAASHPFYRRLNRLTVREEFDTIVGQGRIRQLTIELCGELLREHGFDDFVEA